MSIWFRTPDLAELNAFNANTLSGYLDMQITAYGDDWLEGTMPVNERTVQPFGLLHGGASVALAETLGSLAAYLVLDPARHIAVGQEIGASHVRAARTGRVTGRASPIHLGGRSQVWNIDIRNEAGQPVCVSRLTMAVLERR